MITVIVPVYNAELYIERCIQSVIKQTFSKWKLILIDDGSSDHSFNIMQKYQMKDERITVIRQQNCGAGKARNRGIELAESEYTVFLDADDFIDENYFFELSKHNEDIVFIDALQIRDKSSKVEKLSTYSNKSKDDILRSQMTGKMLWGGCRRAVKTKILHENQVLYSEHKVGEEAVFSFKALYFANSFGFIDLPVYNYEVHQGSLSQTMHEDPWGKIPETLKDALLELDCYSRYADTLNSFVITAGAVSLRRLAKVYGYKMFCKKARVKYEHMKSNIDDRYKIDKKNLQFKANVIWLLLKMKCLLPIYFACKVI